MRDAEWASEELLIAWHEYRQRPTADAREGVASILLGDEPALDWLLHPGNTSPEAAEITTALRHDTALRECLDLALGRMVFSELDPLEYRIAMVVLAEEFDFRRPNFHYREETNPTTTPEPLVHQPTSGADLRSDGEYDPGDPYGLRSDREDAPAEPVVRGTALTERELAIHRWHFPPMG
jgi:hypothetical protein